MRNEKKINSGKKSGNKEQFQKKRHKESVQDVKNIKVGFKPKLLFYYLSQAKRTIGGRNEKFRTYQQYFYKLLNGIPEIYQMMEEQEKE